MDCPRMARLHKPRSLCGCFRSISAELFKFIFLLAPDHAEAEDVLQETSVILWRKFGEFQSGTDFFRWAAQIARNVVRDFRKKAARDRHQFWNADVIESIAETRLSDNDSLMQQRTLLAGCVRTLMPADRELMRRCFGRNRTIKAAAERLGRPVNTVYKALNRIRRILMACVEKAQRQEGHRG